MKNVSIHKNGEVGAVLASQGGQISLLSGKSGPLSTECSQTSGRFEFLSAGGCLLCDEIQNNAPLSVRTGLCTHPGQNILLESDRFLFLHDISPLVPGHCLLIPKRHHRSFGRLPPDHFDELRHFRKKCTALVARESCAPLLFEHGSGSGEMQSGACVHHAHIHFLPIRAPVQRWMAEAGEVELTRTPRQFDSPERFGLRDYLAYEDEHGRSFVVTRLTKRLPCQFIRRRVAAHLGLTDWNWETRCIGHLAQTTLDRPTTNCSAPDLCRL